jgi:outer membrane usher protein
MQTSSTSRKRSTFRPALAVRKWLAIAGLTASLATNAPCNADPVTSSPPPPQAASTSAPTSSADKGERAPLSLVVNGVAKGDLVAVVRPTDVLLGKDDAQSAGVPFTTAALVAFGGAEYVSLASLAPHATYRLDLATVTLRVTVDPTLLGGTSVALDESGASSAAATRSDPSGFLTYSLTSDTANLGGDASLFLQGGATVGAGLLSAGGSYGSGDVRRGLISYQLDSQARLNRLTIGDELVSSDALGASTVLGGIGVSRHFELQPDYAYFPSPGLSGTVLGPTTADVYVNGSFVRSVQLAPGNFNLSDIPVPAGAGVSQIVLRDAYGNSQTLSGAFYETRALLRKGLSDYDYHLGFVRSSPFGATDTYGPLAAIGSYRLGLTNALTAGARVERWAGSVDGGPELDVGLPLGHLSLEPSLSSTFGVSGSAFAAGYDYFGRRFSLSLSALTQSQNYATPSLAAGAQRTRSSLRENLSFPLTRTATLALSNTTSTYTLEPAAGQLMATLDVQVPRLRAYVSLSAERDSGGSILGLNGPASSGHWTVGAQTSFSVGKGASLSASTSSTGAGYASTLQFAKGTPSGPGFGYQAVATSGKEPSAAAQLDYHTQYGNVQVLSNTSGSAGLATTLTLNGSLAGFQQGIFFAPPITSAYALADVPGYRGLAVFSGGQYAGRTDGRDAAVVPNLDPYNDNSIGIDQLSDRLDLIEDQSTLKLRPRESAGVVARFSVRQFHAYTGRVVIRRNGTTLVPALGSLALILSKHGTSTDLGSQGQFYVENLEPGSYEATVTAVDDSSCTFRIDLPPGKPDLPVTSIGTATCEATP